MNFFSGLSFSACFMRANQCSQHFTQNLGRIEDSADGLFLRLSDPLHEEDVGFQFLKRPLSETKKLDVFTAAIPSVPSAMFAGTEAAARRICDTIPYNSPLGKRRVIR